MVFRILAASFRRFFQAPMDCLLTLLCQLHPLPFASEGMTCSLTLTLTLGQANLGGESRNRASLST